MLMPGKSRRRSEASHLISRTRARHEDEGKGKLVKKLFLLGCASLIPFGAHYMKHSLGPLKTYFVADGYSQEEFGAFLSATSWPAMFMPFVAGVVVDERGHEFSAVLFTVICLVGHLLFALFLANGFRSFWLALAGRITYGFGESGTGIAQGAIIGSWFHGDSLAFAIGISESVHYLANFAGKALPAAIAEFEHSYQRAVWVSSGFLFVSVFISVVYYVFEKSQQKFQFAMLRRRSSAQSKNSFHFREDSSSSSPQGVSYYGTVIPGPEIEALLEEEEDDEARNIEFYVSLQVERMKELPLSFWLIGVMHLIFSSLHNLFGGFSTDFIANKTQISVEWAALIASIDSFLPIFLAPVIGFVVDRFGGRIFICIIASLCSIVAFGIFIGEVSASNGVVAMILLSVVTSTTPTLVKSAVPVVVQRSALGTAFGLYSVFESFGGSVGHVAFGYLRDISESYSDDIGALLLLSFVSFVINVVAAFQVPQLNGRSF